METDIKWIPKLGSYLFKMNGLNMYNIGRGMYQYRGVIWIHVRGKPKITQDEQ